MVCFCAGVSEEPDDSMHIFTGHTGKNSMYFLRISMAGLFVFVFIHTHKNMMKSK